MTYKQINYVYIQKESVRCILIKIKDFFLISKDFIMNMDKFLISIFFFFISSINLGIFNLFQWYGLIYVFFLIHGTTDIQVKKWNSSSKQFKQVHI